MDRYETKAKTLQLEQLDRYLQSREKINFFNDPKEVMVQKSIKRLHSLSETQPAL